MEAECLWPRVSGRSGSDENWCLQFRERLIRRGLLRLCDARRRLQAEGQGEVGVSSRVDGIRSSHQRWHLDEVFVKINGERHNLWRTVDQEGELLESFVTKTRDKRAALKFLKKTLKRHGGSDEIVTDRLRSYGTALRELGISDRLQTGRWANNRAENSHQPFRRRERAMLRFRRMRTLQKSASVYASVRNHFSQERTLNSRQNFKANRSATLAEWRDLCTA